MRFKCHYISTTDTSNQYWRTVDADSVNEATTLAKRYRRKGYMLGAVIQDMGNMS